LAHTLSFYIIFPSYQNISLKNMKNTTSFILLI
jgi:hypothetical protein